MSKAFWVVFWKDSQLNRMMYVIYVEVLNLFRVSHAAVVARQYVWMEPQDALIAMRMVSFYALHVIGEKEETAICTTKQDFFISILDACQLSR